MLGFKKNKQEYFDFYFTYSFIRSYKKLVKFLVVIRILSQYPLNEAIEYVQ